jgi:CheY-like chemotaxis protein
MESGMKLVMFAGADATDRAILQYAVREARANLNLIFVRTAGDAIPYLSGEGRFADRHRYPLPAILVLDLTKPRVNCWEILDWLKTRPELSHIRICFISAENDHATVSKASSHGQCFFPKPADATSYVEMVEALVAENTQQPKLLVKH